MINYQRLVNAQHFYTKAGYENIDSPWVVDSDIDDITRPPSKQPFIVSDHRLVASGEQSFLQLRSDGKLDDGQYQTITPCFRNEREDAIHQKTFMKLELIHIANRFSNNAAYDILHQMILDSRSFFEHQGVDVKVVMFERLMYDIICKRTGIELGSYGLRKHHMIGEWIYGTGLAEPRFGYVVERNKVTL